MRHGLVSASIGWLIGMLINAPPHAYAYSRTPLADSTTSSGNVCLLDGNTEKVWAQQLPCGSLTLPTGEVKTVCPGDTVTEAWSDRCTTAQTPGSTPCRDTDGHISTADMPDQYIPWTAVEGTGTNTSTATNKVVHGGDDRLSNARPPTGGVHALGCVATYHTNGGTGTATDTTTSTAWAYNSDPTVTCTGIDTGATLSGVHGIVYPTTASSTHTATRAPTGTETTTATQTVTIPVTVTGTGSVTASGTNTQSATSTASATATISRTVTETRTGTGTVTTIGVGAETTTRTVTLTETVTSSQTATASGSVTKSLTGVGTGVATDASTGNVSGTLVGTATAASTGTITGSAAAVGTGTWQNTGNITSTATFASTSAVTVTLTGTGVGSGTGSVTITDGNTFTKSATKISTGILSKTLTAFYPSTGTNCDTATSASWSVPNGIMTGTRTQAGEDTTTVTATVTNTAGTETATGTTSYTGTVTATYTGTLSSTATTTYTVTATLTTLRTDTNSGSVTVTRSYGFTGEVTATGTGTYQDTSASWSATGNVTATWTVTSTASATGYTLTVTGTASNTQTVSQSMTGTVALSNTVSGTGTGTGTWTSVGTTTATAPITYTGTSTDTTYNTTAAVADSPTVAFRPEANVGSLLKVDAAGNVGASQCYDSGTQTVCGGTASQSTFAAGSSSYRAIVGEASGVGLSVGWAGLGFGLSSSLSWTNVLIIGDGESTLLRSPASGWFAFVIGDNTYMSLDSDGLGVTGQVTGTNLLYHPTAECSSGYVLTTDGSPSATKCVQNGTGTGVGGSGTSGKLAKWTNSSTIGDGDATAVISTLGYTPLNPANGVNCSGKTKVNATDGQITSCTDATAADVGAPSLADFDAVTVVGPGSTVATSTENTWVDVTTVTLTVPAGNHNVIATGTATVQTSSTNICSTRLYHVGGAAQIGNTARSSATLGQPTVLYQTSTASSLSMQVKLQISSASGSYYCYVEANQAAIVLSLLPRPAS